MTAKELKEKALTPSKLYYEFTTDEMRVYEIQLLTEYRDWFNRDGYLYTKAVQIDKFLKEKL